MKYQINQKVGLISKGQLGTGFIIKRTKFFWTTIYSVVYKVKMIDENNKVAYTEQRVGRYFEGSLFELEN